jgi:hypothetical protein
MAVKREYLPSARFDKTRKGYVTGGPNTRNFVVTDPTEMLRLAEAWLVTARRLSAGEIKSVRLYTPVYERKGGLAAGYVSLSYLPVTDETPVPMEPDHGFPVKKISVY